MKCLNCGCETEQYICEVCQKDEIWSNTLGSILYYNDEKCENEYVRAYVKSFKTPEDAKSTIPKILQTLSKENKEYFDCIYLSRTKSDDFVKHVESYLDYHKEWTFRRQSILKLLLDWYGVDDLITPEPWYDMIESTKGLYCDLYFLSAEYRSYVGDYDVADKMLKKVYKLCNDKNYNLFFYSKDGILKKADKRADLLEKYKAGKPYWPITEERRQMVAQIYDKKGIAYGGTIEPKPSKVKEADFSMPSEYSGKVLNDYCTFWCSECFSVVTSQDIYEIAAVKVRKNKKVDTFRSYIKPWNGGEKVKKSAAKEAGITLEELNAQKSVSIVMKEFFEFVGNDVLVSTEAMGKQKNLLTRAARYSKYTSIPNQMLDINHYAEDYCKQYMTAIVDRNKLLSDLHLTEGKNALEKATRNHQIYQKIKVV